MHYYTTNYNICQERNFIMEDPDPLLIRRTLVINTAAECTDANLLDLIYILLINHDT